MEQWQIIRVRISERKKHSEKKFIVLIAGKWEMLLYPKQNILINVKEVGL